MPIAISMSISQGVSTVSKSIAIPAIGSIESIRLWFNHNIHIHAHSHIHVHIPGSKHGVQVRSHDRHRIHREHRTLVQHQHHAFHIYMFHGQDHIHGHNQDVHNHVLENKCCVQDHIPHNCHREHRHQPLAQPQLHAFHIRNIHDHIHIHGHSQEKSSLDFHNHKHGVQDHILHKNHREHQPQLLVQPQQHACHIHMCHSQDHIHDHNQGKSSQDVHSHVPKNKCGAQDHIHREHQPWLLVQPQHHAFHIHNIHDHNHDKSSQDAVHHSQDDDQHSHTEGQHQQQPELLCKPGELS